MNKKKLIKDIEYMIRLETIEERQNYLAKIIHKHLRKR